MAKLSHLLLQQRSKMMTERLLQYIWQFQYFNKQELFTTDGGELQVVHEGQFNSNQGPDFLNARVRVNSQLWIGHVELHIRTSDWERHSHDHDPNYGNVILHVVWEHDACMEFRDIPTLEMQSRVPRLLLQQYDNWMAGERFIPCQKNIVQTNAIVWKCWTERMLIERMQRRSQQVFALLEQNNHHWEETLWWMIARSFGLVVNGEVFEELAMSVPLKVLRRHHGQLLQLEAILFGQAGLLNKDYSGKYPQLLWREYLFLNEKYSFKKMHQRVQFLRMRPASFPTIRIAQLAMLIHESPGLFARATVMENSDELKKMLNVVASDYWNDHFVFEEESAFEPKKPGAQLVNTIMINSVIPFLFAYGEYRNEERYLNRALDWIREIPGEKNKVTRGFNDIGIPVGDAAASQALLELKSQYCDARRCLECAVGAAMLHH